jgi:hypothetical protein
MISPYIIKQVSILLIKGFVQASDGSWHCSTNILSYEKNRPILTPKQRYLRSLYLDKAFFTNDFIHWFSTSESLINSLKNKCKK